MITNTGKAILAKYLIGQAPAYASYIAVGCGPKPIASSSTASVDYSEKESLDFEMFRVPISSRGYVSTDSNNTELVLTAELPTEERYEITEIGIYSAGANPSAGANDSRVLYSFSSGENWEIHEAEVAEGIIQEFGALDTEGNSIIRDDIGNAGVAFITNADNALFSSGNRQARGERSRFLNSMTVLRGDLSPISKTGSLLIPDAGARHIHLTGTQVGLDRNSPNDEIRLAFSVISKEDTNLVNPDTVRIIVEFASDDTAGQSGQYAQLQQEFTASDFENSRYLVLSKTLQELPKSPEFSWSSVSIVKIYVSVLDELGDPDDQYYVALDAIRFENLNTKNALYGLTGYTVLRTEDGTPVTKEGNTANLVEFRFAMDVV
jgi:hypothetical protein